MDTVSDFTLCSLNLRFEGFADLQLVLDKVVEPIAHCL
jgi:hypothetical protein